MHDTAYAIGSKFLEIYCRAERCVVLEIGSMNVNGSLRTSCPTSAIYVGVDVERGNGVDIVADPRHPMPIRSGSSDVTISTSQMEHDPCFWNTFLELCRVTKEGGYIYLSAPSNGSYHTYPIDVWRFYPDAGKALTTWANDNNHDITLVESFTAPRRTDEWNDFVAVFHVGKIPDGTNIDFLIDHFGGYNAWKVGSSHIENFKAVTEDGEIIQSLRQDNARLMQESEAMESLRQEVARLQEQVRSLTSQPEQAGAIGSATEESSLDKDAAPDVDRSEAP